MTQNGLGTWNGSSYRDRGKRRAGYAVVTMEATIEARALPPGTSQNAKLTALIKALELCKGRFGNRYTDSK